MAADPQQRSRLPVDERRRLLLHTARQLFAERGYEGLAVDDLARRAGVSTGLMYHYFGGKRGLYLEVVQEAADELFAATEPPADAEPVDRIRAGLDAHLAWCERHADGYVKLLAAGGADDDVRAMVEGTRDRFVDRMATAIGAPPSPELTAALHGWLGYTEGVTLHWLDARAPAREALLDLLVASFIAVLGAVHRVTTQE